MGTIESLKSMSPRGWIKSLVGKVNIDSSSDVRSDVPQGSVVGCFLCSIYISDLITNMDCQYMKCACSFTGSKMSTNTSSKGTFVTSLSAYNVKAQLLIDCSISQPLRFISSMSPIFLWFTIFPTISFHYSAHEVFLYKIQLCETFQQNSTCL